MAVLPGIAMSASREGPSGWSCELQVEADSPCFAGHFPDRPILPGIVHVGLVVGALAELSGSGHRLARIDTLRLKQVVGPADRLSLEISRPDDAGLVTFVLRREEQVVSLGRMVVESQGERDR